jgi:hypothetical protein
MGLNRCEHEHEHDELNAPILALHKPILIPVRIKYKPGTAAK